MFFNKNFISSWRSSICEPPGLKHWKVAKQAIYGELWLRWFEIVSSLNDWAFPWIMHVLKGLWKWSFEAVAGYYGKDQWLLMSYLTLLAGLDSIYVDILFNGDTFEYCWLCVKILKWFYNLAAMFIHPNYWIRSESKTHVQ